jgi:hypothetical protein
MTPRLQALIGFALFAGSSPLAAQPQPGSELVSRYASEVNEAEYPAAIAPALAPVLSLDFSKVYTHRYFFLQTLENHVNGAETGMGSAYSSNSSGDLMVYAEPDHTAQVRIENLKIQSTSTVEGKPTVTGQKAPATWIGNLSQAGGFDEAVPGQSPLVGLLFPVPSKALAVGASVETPVKFNLPIMGAVYTATGSRRITCAGYVTVGRRVCAKLEQTIEVSVVDEESHHRVDARGRAVSYFSLDEGRFVRSAGTMTMQMTSSPPPASSLDRGKAPAKAPPPLVTSDNFVKIVLAE